MNSRLNLLCLTLCCGLFASVGYAEETPVKPTHAVSLTQAHKGNLEIDTYLLDSFGRLPQRRRTFYLAGRQILSDSPTATPSDPKIIAAAKEAEVPLISGPMLGDVSESGITVWFRPIHSEALTVQVTTEGKKNKDFPADVTRPGAVTRVRLTDLPPNTQHTYQIVNGAGSVLGEGSFRTAPKPNTGETIRIAFGSCFHKIGVHNPNLMRLVAERGNYAMLLLGDLAVDDRESKVNMHYADYLLRDVSKPWRTFSASIPVYTSWDDHDYLNNDKSGLQKGQIGDKERNALRQVWKDNWNNPPTRVEDRGIYFNTVIGDVEIIMLDTRSCRTWKKRGKRGAYLGDEQMDWLFRTLKASSARFIILTSGTMWSDYMSKAKDSWGSWDILGREKIFDFIEKNKIGGVLLLSGDRHGARGFKIKRPSGFTLHEFEAATLGGVPGPGAFAPDRSSQMFGYKGGLKAFGEFTFDMSKPDPEATFRLINEEGKELETHTFLHSLLVPRKNRANNPMQATPNGAPDG
jgi:alkaline phosphatase D